MYVIYVLHPNYLRIGLVPQMHVGIQGKNWSPRQQREPYQKKMCGKYETSRQQQSELEFNLFRLVSI
jgi:hypothetical protein